MVSRQYVMNTWFPHWKHSATDGKMIFRRNPPRNTAKIGKFVKILLELLSWHLAGIIIFINVSHELFNCSSAPEIIINCVTTISGEIEF